MRIEPQRRHGPFDPRYRIRRSSEEAIAGPRTGATAVKEVPEAMLAQALETWESEGGAGQ
jgi:hypothetical protein